MTDATYTLDGGSTEVKVGTLAASTDPTRWLVVADSDGDGWLDVFVGNDLQQNRVYYGDGEGNFPSVGAIGITSEPTYILLASDLNNDGNLDAVAANLGSGIEVTLGVSVVVPFDLTAADYFSTEQISKLEFSDATNSQVTISGIEVIVGEPSMDPTNFAGEPDSQCRNSADPYIPVTVRFRIDFPMLTCYTPECIILNPLEGIGKFTQNAAGVTIPQCPSTGISYSHIHREIRSAPPPSPLPPLSPPPLQPPASPPSPEFPMGKPPPRLCYYIKWRDEGCDYMNYRPVFPIDVIPEGHPMLTSGISQPGGIAAGQPFPSGFTLDIVGQVNVEDEPVRVPMSGLSWFWWDMDTLSNSYELLTQQATVVEMPAANAFYAYGHPFSWSANTGTELSNTINLFFLKDELDVYYSFYIIDKAWDGSGGDYRMTLTATEPVVTFQKDETVLQYYDRYTDYVKGGIPGASPWYGNMTQVPGQIPILLRDDPWNKYIYDLDTGKAEFHWYWLECCTDGMVIGPLPMPTKSEADEGFNFNITWEGHCDNMVNLDQGTRIQQWHPFKDEGSWIHYDVPMEQTCLEYQGIQLSARTCESYCQDFSNCGECTGQLDCFWQNDACRNIVFTSDYHETKYVGGENSAGRCCSECAAISVAHDCISEDGCGWAPFEKRCVSGTPDFPCDDSVTVIQWHPPAYCYKASYNEKVAFASFARMEEFSVQPATHYVSQHPKRLNNVANCQTTVTGEFGPIWDEQDYLARTLNAGDYISHPILAEDFWSRTGSTRCTDASVAEVGGSAAFYAYNYPQQLSSNTGMERSGYVNAFLILDNAGDVYMIMTIDSATDGTGGYMQVDMDGTGGLCQGDFVRLMGTTGASLDERDTYTNTWSAFANASVSFGWDAYSSDGMIVGPFPKNEWSLNMKVITEETRGLDEFCIGTYDVEKNDIGCITLGIKKATSRWGGVQFDALDCTTYCQRHSDCGECVKDINCQFAPQNGGCIAKGAYVYDFGCPRPTFPPLTMMMARGDAPFSRERRIDDWQSSVR